MRDKWLNLGCQVHHFDSTDKIEWINQDIISDDKNIKAELYCDAINLPLESDSISGIYAGHLVEHFYPDTLPTAITEWHRVLKNGGKIVVVTPDSGAVMRDYASGKLSIEGTWQQIYGRIYSWDTPSERHHIAFDDYRLCKFFTKHAQWQTLEMLDFNNPPEEIKPFMDTHISRGAYQIGIVCTK